MTEKSAIKQRNLGVDLLRIAAMIMVLMHHFLGHGLVLDTVSTLSLNWFVFWFIKCFCYTSVTVFYLISAYYQSKKSIGLKSIIKIWLQVEFYSVICYGVAVLFGIVPFGIGGMLKSLFPVIFRQYGFFNGYLLMAMLSPFLNKMFSSMSRKMHIGFILLFGVLCTVIPYITFLDSFNMNYGEGTLWIILLYAIGFYLQSYVNTEKCGVVRPLVLTLALVTTTWLSKAVIAIFTKAVFKEVKYSGAFVGETQILMLIASVSLFVLSINLNKHIKGRISGVFITQLAPLVFSVFLVTENNNLRKAVWSFFAPYQYANDPIWKMAICFVFSLVLCFTFPMVAEKVRAVVERKLKISERLAYLLSDSKLTQKINYIIDSKINVGEQI